MKQKICTFNLLIFIVGIFFTFNMSSCSSGGNDPQPTPTPQVSSSECTSAANDIYTSDNVFQPTKLIQTESACTSVADAFGNSKSNDADTARFFAALTSVAAKGIDFSSDGDTSNGINTTGEFLEEIGCDSPALSDQNDITCSLIGIYEKGDDPDIVILHLNADSTYTEGTQTGTYSTSGNTISFTSVEGEIRNFTYWTDFGSLDLMDSSGMISEYSKQSVENLSTTEKLIDFFKNAVAPDLQDAISYLDSISETFNATWTEPFGGTTTEIDYGDVLTLRSFLESTLGSIQIITANNLIVDPSTIDETTDIGTFLNNNSQFLTLTSQASMASAENNFKKAASDALAAFNFIDNETDSQANDFINMNDWTQEEKDELEADLTELQTTLTNSSYTLRDEVTQVQVGVIDLSIFFSGMNLRSYLPPFTNGTPGMFPDNTFGGAWSGFSPNSSEDVNTDLNINQVPDILE